MKYITIECILKVRLIKSKLVIGLVCSIIKIFQVAWFYLALENGRMTVIQAVLPVFSIPSSFLYLFISKCRFRLRENESIRDMYFSCYIFIKKHFSFCNTTCHYWSQVLQKVQVSHSKWGLVDRSLHSEAWMILSTAGKRIEAAEFFFFNPLANMKYHLKIRNS